MGRIKNQHRVICALVLARRIHLVQLALTPTEASKAFVVSRPELAVAQSEGLLGSSPDLIPVWRLEQLFPRR